MARQVKRWTEREETRLLLSAQIQRRHCCIDHANAHGRSERAVRVKLSRLENDPVMRPPTMTAATTDAAAPRVPTARGPGGTPDEA